MNETKIFEYVLQTVNEEKLAEMLTHHTLGGVTASDIEEHFHISRANASAYLNKLVTQKLLIKVDSRPVHFFPADLINLYVSDNSLQYTYTVDEFFKNVTSKQDVSAHSSAFDALIGHDGSLAAQIETAKAAIVYPPNGLHTLLIGESGTGKTLFTRTMYNYGREVLNKSKKIFHLLSSTVRITIIIHSSLCPICLVISKEHSRAQYQKVPDWLNRQMAASCFLTKYTGYLRKDRNCFFT